MAAAVQISLFKGFWHPPCLQGLCQPPCYEDTQHGPVPVPHRAACTLWRPRRLPRSIPPGHPENAAPTPKPGHDLGFSASRLPPADGQGRLSGSKLSSALFFLKKCKFLPPSPRVRVGGSAPALDAGLVGAAGGTRSRGGPQSFPWSTGQRCQQRAREL